MTDVRIQEFQIANLEYVFVPPGLPLVTKSEAPATTSILVRGGAGTGKTTLAVALANAIGRAHGGVALYLTTEFVATELSYKAVALDLPEDSVDAWTSARPHPPGAILVEHLVRTRTGSTEDAIKTVAHRKRAAIDAVWEILAHGNEEPVAEREGDLPVRAVVIDGFGLPEIEQEDQQLRHELLTLLQSLELIGITPIVVEEAGAHSEAWLPFVVDIVFEIELWSDPDLGHLVRRLKVPKSRYGQALPGPHDYGLGPTAPAVWPDLRLENGIEFRPLHPAPSIFIPLDAAYAILSPGAVLISEYDEPVTNLSFPFQVTPGVQLAAIDCGPLSKITLPDDRVITVDEANGILSLAWTLFQHRESGFNSVIVQNLEFFLSRSRGPRALRMIAMLSAAEINVCIHGSKSELGETYAVADVVPQKKYAGHTLRRLPPQQPYRADRWLEAFESDHPNAGIDLRKLFSGKLTPASASMEIKDINMRPVTLQATIAAHLVGLESISRHQLNRWPKGQVGTYADVAISMFYGDGIRAANKCIEYPEHPEFMEHWGELSAIYAQNEENTNALLKRSPNLSIRKMRILFRALAGAKYHHLLRDVIQSCCKRLDMPDWYGDRLWAESFLDASDRSDWELAADKLSILADNENIPTIHRAEIAYNLGVAKSRLGDEASASQAYARALEFNEHLEPAANAAHQ